MMSLSGRSAPASLTKLQNQPPLTGNDLSEALAKTERLQLQEQEWAAVDQERALGAVPGFCSTNY